MTKPVAEEPLVDARLARTDVSLSKLLLNIVTAFIDLASHCDSRYCDALDPALILSGQSV